MAQGPQLLRQILRKITEMKGSELPCLVVFDLDSTLFDVSPRVQRILHDFAHHPEYEKRFPESTKILKSVETLKTDWGIKDAIIRAGLDKHSTEFHKAVKQYWIDNFFSSNYLQYDRPYDGAVEFVKNVHQAGAKVVYLSGRDRPGMTQGTRDTLLKWNFPIQDQDSLALKPAKGMDDAEFKRDWFLTIPRNAYQQIWFFENEPLNVNVIRQHFDHIDIVFFESTHARKAQPPVDLPKIFHFLLED